MGGVSAIGRVRRFAHRWRPAMNFVKAIVAAGLVAASTSAFAADITGAGATFPFPIYSKWADAYKKETGNGLNYQSIGSGAGIKQSELVLSGEVLGDIYLGKITQWDDPAIAKLNAKLKLPTDAITVVRRSDGSGTTFNFTDYLSKSNPDWKTKVGSGTAVEWPAGVGAKGNEGVAGNISQTKNSIGYVEYAYAKQNKLTFAALINKAGKTVQPTVAAFQAAASNADWAKAPGYYVILTDQPGEKSWPITAATFILMHKEPVDKAASAEAIKFFKWAFA